MKAQNLLYLIIKLSFIAQCCNLAHQIKLFQNPVDPVDLMRPSGQELIES